MSEVDSEIERLMYEIEIHKGTIAGLGAICRNQRQLITELADALAHWRNDDWPSGDYRDEFESTDALIQRAREAGKDE